MAGTFEGTEALGPTEFVVVGFAGNRFTGDIAPALAGLIDSGLIRVIDLAVVSREADGTVTLLAMREFSPEVAAAFATLEGRVPASSRTPSSPSKRPASSPDA